jgi:hypothetical protein
MTPTTLPDITPGSAATPLSTDTNLQATVIWLTPSQSGGRLGDSNVGGSRGVTLAAGVPFSMPRNDFEQGLWRLCKVYVYGGGTWSVTYA